MIAGGHRVRQDDEAETTHTDPVVLAKRRDLPTGRRALSHVPGRRYAEESHHRRECARPIDPQQDNEGGRDSVSSSA